jgi:Flp pilus assembly protein TadD
MRHTGAENIPHVAWTDHRILKLPAPPDTPVEHPQSAELSPILSPGATRRDLAMAYYQAFLEGNQSAEPQAWRLLQEQRSAMENDERALDAFGNLSAERGDSHAAEAAFQQVLKLDPRDLTALSNLGILHAKQGNLPSAISLLQSAFDANKDIAGLAMNLARVQCMAGDAAGARATVEAALVYGPGLEDLLRMRDQMPGCGAPKNQEAAPR